jgi:tetratricopeptide (TPR) repeat protein
MSRQVFISYIAKDSLIAQALAAALEEAGHSTWYYERDSIPLLTHLKQVRESIEASRAVLLVVSAETANSNQVAKEVKRAHDAGKPILPLLVRMNHDDFKRLCPELEYAAGGNVAVELAEGEPRAAAAAIIQGLQRRGINPATPSDAICSHDSSLIRGPGFPTCPRLIEVEPRVPAAPLFGSEKVLEEALRKIKTHSLAIAGISGIGKSKLMSALLERLQERSDLGFKRYYWRRFTYGHPPSFAEFGTRLIHDLTQAEADIQRSETSEQVQLVLRALRQEACALFIDQFESVIDSQTRSPKDPGFADLLTWANQGLGPARLIVTAWEVPKDSRGLAFPSMMLAGLDQTAGMKLIRNIISGRRAKPGTTDRHKEMVRRLKGHPFALELIARNYAENDWESTLMAHDQFREAAVDSLAAEIASKTVARLSPELGHLLSAVCVFSRPVGIAGIASVAAIPESRAFEGLRELCQRGVVSELREEQYESHELVRQHVLRRLSGDARRHLHAAAAKFCRDLPGVPREERSGLADVRNPLDSIGHYLQAMQMIRDAVRDPELESRNCGCLANSLNAQGLKEEARTWYERAVEICRTTGDRRCLGIWLGGLGALCDNEGENDRATGYYEEAANLANLVRDRRHQSWWLGVLGQRYAARGELARAREVLMRAIAISEEILFRRGLRYQLERLAELALTETDFDAAGAFLHRAEIVASEMADDPAVQHYRKFQQHVLAAHLEHSLAWESPSKAVERVCVQLEREPDNARWLILAGRAFGRLGKAEGRREALNKGIECFTRALIQGPDQWAYRGRAACNVHAGYLEAARSDYEKLIALEGNDPGAALSKMEVEVSLGRYADARSTFDSLRQDTLPPEFRLVSDWLMCLALALDGMSFDEHLAAMKDNKVRMGADSYDPTDIEPYLTKLRELLPQDRVQNAEAIHALFKSHFVTQ